MSWIGEKWNSIDLTFDIWRFDIWRLTFWRLVYRLAYVQHVTEAFYDGCGLLGVALLVPVVKRPAVAIDEMTDRYNPFWSALGTFDQIAGKQSLYEVVEVLLGPCPLDCDCLGLACKDWQAVFDTYGSGQPAEFSNSFRTVPIDETSNK